MLSAKIRVAPNSSRKPNVTSMRKVSQVQRAILAETVDPEKWQWVSVSYLALFGESALIAEETSQVSMHRAL